MRLIPHPTGQLNRRRAAEPLRIAGLVREAGGGGDERLLSAWLESVHNTVERAFANEYYQDAIRILEQACAILEQISAGSPFIQSLILMLKFQCDLIEKTVRMQQAVVRQVMQSQIQERIRDVNQPYYQPVELSRELDGSRKNLESVLLSRKSELSEDFLKLFSRRKDELRK